VTGGIVAGIAGAVVLALFRVALGTILYWAVTRMVGSTSVYPARFARSLIWAAVKVPAYPFVGQRALEPGFDASVVLLGSVNHLAVSICWGVLFGLIAHGSSRRAIIALGILYGILIWLVSCYVLLPLIGASPLAGGPGVVIEFVPYGLAIAIAFLLWQRRLRRLGITEA
jgi:uncharacterized membrane protein YagU involved in acid resistance